MPTYSYDEIVPVVHPSAFVHETAVLIGDVIVEHDCYIGPGAVLRGDFGRISVGMGSNVQETCVIHSFPNEEVVMEKNSHIGHGAILHGCHIGENVLIGMNAVIMDKSNIGKNCIVGALSFVKAGQKFDPGLMIAGSPAKVLRNLTEEEIQWKRRGTGIYQALARKNRKSLVRTAPLTELEEGRRKVSAPDYDPLLVDRLSQV